MYSPPCLRHHLELFHKELVEDPVRDEHSVALMVGFFKVANCILLSWSFTIIKIETYATCVVQVVKPVVKEDETLTCEPASWTCSI